LLSSTQVFAPTPTPTQSNGFASAPNTWYPAELGSPSSSGGQNNSRYAYFPGTRRLAVDTGGEVAIYDTLDHQIGGVQQQQGGPWGSFSFSSQFGTFTVDSLPRLNGAPAQVIQQPAPPAPAPIQQSLPSQQSYASNVDNGGQFSSGQFSGAQSSGGQFSDAQSSGDVLAAIERLGQLYNQGVLSNDEFLSKKAELLSRL
jgi:hypothetical protein